MENKKTILVVEIVEDEASITNVLTDKLHNEGFSVIKANNGKEGIDVAKEKHPDLILLDIKMPVMNGIEMLKVLRNDEWGQTVPVIVLSNLSDTETIAEAIDKNTFEYFVKADTKLQEVIEKIKQKLCIPPKSQQS
ncbi:MAG: response regulator [Candidatus Parcubacteria bacterium]|nr:response regulator [Candidatus Parcubacteria bacterium]